MTIHVVKRGESIWAISKKYGVSIAAINQVNGLPSTNKIVPGLALYIPESKLSLRTYQVKAGDFLWKIAQRFDTSVTSIVIENPNVDPNALYIGQRLNIPSPSRLRIASLGFIVPYSIETSLENLDRIAEQLTYLAVVAYSLTDEGYAYVVLNDSDIITRSWQRNVIPLLMIRNFKDGEFSPELIGSVLENPTYRNHLIDSLVQLAKQRGYGGVSIDFEFIPPERRDDFTLFLNNLKTKLGNLILQVNIHAKSKDLPTNRIVGGYDYRAIGNAVDLVAVMTIDYGYPTGPPDPIAPIWWVEQVLRYATTQINPRKLLISIALYGYDKVVGTNVTRALSVQGSQNQAISTGSIIEYDQIAQSPWYQYWRGTEKRIVWFEDIRSFIEKYNAIDLYQLAGTTFWQINLSAPQNWAYVESNIEILKDGRSHEYLL
ncbi:MAG TPA: LysM peptidoglycan-binding domain-containing protein [Bacillus sp. (in: firmicutes)]